jgi:hypothetical protein
MLPGEASQSGLFRLAFIRLFVGAGVPHDAGVRKK